MTMIPHSSSSLRIRDFKYIERIVQRNFVAEGVLAERFGKKLAHRSSRRSSVLTASGTFALEAALHTLSRKHPKKKKVAVSGYICPAVVNAIMRVGLRPQFLDVMDNAMGISMAAAMEAVDGSTIAIILSHLGGIPDDSRGAENCDCPIISDCAQAIGATFDGVPVEAIGEFAVLSFGPTKMITAGLGGALLGNDPEQMEIARKYVRTELTVAEYQKNGFEVTLGQSLPDLNAGLGTAQLGHLSKFIMKRREIARGYDQVLFDQGNLARPEFPTPAVGNGYRYYFLSDDATDWVSWLRAHQVDARASIAHNMGEYFSGQQHLKNLKNNVRRVVSLPIYPELQRARKIVYEALRRGLDAGLK